MATSNAASTANDHARSFIVADEKVANMSSTALLGSRITTLGSSDENPSGHGDTMPPFTTIDRTICARCGSPMLSGSSNVPSFGGETRKPVFAM